MVVTHLADTLAADTTSPAAAPPRDPATTRSAPSFEPGVKVEVRRRLDDKWARGFEILATCEAGYRLRRLSDGVEIPAVFAAADVRRERKRDTWWY